MMMTGVAISTVPLVLWAMTGEPTGTWVKTFAGFACGFCWALVYARYAFEKAGF